jgi:GGDEF domain-containing protein
MHDPRTDEAIDALLAGRARRRGRPTASPIPLDGARHPTGLLSRVAWTEALGRESARLERYGHVAAVAVFQLADSAGGASTATTDGDGDGWLERLAGPVARTIRRGARETDLITRAGPGRYQVLLPETTESEAGLFAERVAADCGAWFGAIAAPVTIRASVAAATTGESQLEDALDRALALLND